MDAGSVVVHIFQGEEWRREVRHGLGCGFGCQLFVWDGGKGSDARYAVAMAGMAGSGPALPLQMNADLANKGLTCPDPPSSRLPPCPPPLGQYDLEGLWGHRNGSNIRRIAPKKTVHTLDSLRA